MSVDLSAPVTLLPFISSVDENRGGIFSCLLWICQVRLIGLVSVSTSLMGALPIREAHQKDWSVVPFLYVFTFPSVSFCFQLKNRSPVLLFYTHHLPPESHTGFAVTAVFAICCVGSTLFGFGQAPETNAVTTEDSSLPDPAPVSRCVFSVWLSAI